MITIIKKRTVCLFSHVAVSVPFFLLHTLGLFELLLRHWRNKNKIKIKIKINREIEEGSAVE